MIYKGIDKVQYFTFPLTFNWYSITKIECEKVNILDHVNNSILQVVK